MNVHPTLTELRDFAVTALGIVPAAKSWLAGMKFLKQPHFSEGCVVTPAATLPKTAAALVGRSLSQPGVRLATGTSVPLDTVLGPGWALLHFIDGPNIEIRAFANSPSDGAPTLTVTDDAGTFGHLAGTGISLLVRPDRYVAAAVEASAVATALESLSRYSPRLKQASAQTR